MFQKVWARVASDTLGLSDYNVLHMCFRELPDKQPRQREFLIRQVEDGCSYDYDHS